MFGDSARPLYRLCHTMKIGRISETHYLPYLNTLARGRWGEDLPPQVFAQLMHVTERHPFYLNVLCQSVWMEKSLPTTEEIDQLWRQYVEDNRHIVGESEIKFNSASMKKAVEVLLEKDLAHFDEGYYKVLDPAISYYLSCLTPLV
jgi:hypothetical protein